MLIYSSKLISEFSQKARQILPITRITRRAKLLEVYKKATLKDTKAEARGVFREDIKQPRFEHDTNYNNEQYSQYGMQIKEAQQLLIQKEEDKERKSKRPARIYDRPKFDLDLSNYTAWIQVSDQLYKEHTHASKVVGKITVSPKDLKYVKIYLNNSKVFGHGNRPWRNDDATREYDFQDSDLTKFLMYNSSHVYIDTTTNKPQIIRPTNLKHIILFLINNDKDSQNLDHIKPRSRQLKRPTPEEFWNSSEPTQFRVNCSAYGDFKKFRHWFGEQLVDGLKKTKSYHDRVLEKYPTVDYFEDFEKEHILDAKPAIYAYDRSFFLPKGTKLDPTKIFQEPIEAPKLFKDGEKITVEQYLEIQRQEKIEQQKIASRS